MKARIYRPARTAMQQSGQADNNHWVLKFMPEAPAFVDPLMGWTGMTDMAQEVNLTFTSQEEAVEYAKRHGLEFELKDPQKRVIRPKSYAVNFSFNRVIDTPDSHG